MIQGAVFPHNCKMTPTTILGRRVKFAGFLVDIHFRRYSQNSVQMFRDRFLKNFFQTCQVSSITQDIYAFDFATTFTPTCFFVPIVPNCPSTRMMQVFTICVCEIFLAYSWPHVVCVFRQNAPKNKPNKQSVTRRLFIVSI